VQFIGMLSSWKSHGDKSGAIHWNVVLMDVPCGQS
jgi:hypothetical protein